MLFTFFMCASFARWDGGMAMGPRHLVSILPHVALASGVALERMRSIADRPLRIVLTTLAAAAIAYAVVVCTACVAVMPEFPDVAIPIRVEDMATPHPEHPLTTLVLPLIARGYVSVKGTTPTGSIGYAIGFEGHDDDAINIGERLGLRGLASLVPLFVVWLAAAFALARAARRSNHSLR